MGLDGSNEWIAEWGSLLKNSSEGGYRWDDMTHNSHNRAIFSASMPSKAENVPKIRE